jgi:hypothetical protein
MAWYKIERKRKLVTILPEPPQDPVGTERLKKLFPVEDGWIHSSDALIHQSLTVEEARQIELRAGVTLWDCSQ